MTARTRCWWVKLRECSLLPFNRRFPLRLELAVYESYARPAIMCGENVWLLRVFSLLLYFFYLHPYVCLSIKISMCIEH